MLKFFRNIRQQLLTKNQPIGRYLLYAIGEIILVVIGILIALQINNWNETKKDRVFEVKMLTEIKKVLDSDKRDFENLIQRMERLDSMTIHLATRIYNTSIGKDLQTEKDDLNLSLLYTGFQYQYNRGPYDALRSSGIDKIVNDSLRNELIRLYDFTFPRNMEITQWYDRAYVKQIEQVKSFLTETEIVSENGEIKFKRTFKKDLLNDQKFIDLLEEINNRAENVKRSLNYIIPRMTALKTQIEEEIDRKIK